MCGMKKFVAPKKNILKLNKLQLRTLALAQLLANDPTTPQKNNETVEVTLLSVPHPHGNHVHVGRFVVSAREASGFSNMAVWTALNRKGLAIISYPLTITLTARGVEYDTGLGERFLTESDH